MVVNAYVGSPYKLVFPLLSSGYLEIDYDKTVTQIEGTSGTVGGSGDDTNTPTASTISDTRNIQMWNHTGPFSLECIVTPYDVNGSAKTGASEFGVLDSTKTPPYPSDTLSSRSSTYQSTSILGTSSGTKYTDSPLKMMIFHNTNVKLYLENTTDNSYNQPAEYKIVAEFKRTGGTTIKLETDTVIKAENKLTGYYDPYGYYDGIATSLTKLDDASRDISNTSMIELDTASNVNKVGKGTELFDQTGTSIGKVVSIDTNAGTLTMSQVQSASIGSAYISQLKEALYLEQMYKISFTYLPNAAEIYLNNNLVASTSHTESTVVIHPSDIRICGSGTTSEQFYGELYEIALHKGNSINTTTQKTLSPSYSNIFFYFRFGE